jgi:hypothetical protein
MKKLMMSTMALALVSFFSVNSTATAVTPSISNERIMDQGKEPVKPEDLPDPIKKALANAPYNEWQVASAFSVTADDGKQHYEIDLKKGEEETTTVKLDKDGNPVE